MNVPKCFSDKQIKLLVLSVIITIIFYGVMTFWSGSQTVFHYFKVIGFKGVTFILLLSLVNYILRFLRWHNYIQQTHFNFVSLWRHFVIYLSGFALTTTPAKAGETIRGIFLKKYNIPFHVTIACFFSERILDLIAILSLCVIGFMSIKSHSYIIIIGLILIILLLIIIKYPIFLLKINQYTHSWSLFDKAINYVYNILLTSRDYYKLNIFIKSLILSLIAWFSEAYGLYYALKIIGYDITLLQAIFIYSIAMLVGALSFVPGGVGTSEAIMIGLLISIDIPLDIATMITIFIRVATLWFAVLLGIISFIGMSYENDTLKKS